MNPNLRTLRAFTLIELMVTISIIGILVAIITASFNTARAKSRDAKRISDVANIQLALANFFDRCSVYPTTLGIALVDAKCPTGITLGSFIAKIPTPPTPATDANDYRYGINVGQTDYVLASRLENNNSALVDSIPTMTTPYNFSLGGVPTPIDCDKTKFNYCVGPK